MATIDVISMQGEVVGNLEVADAVFAAPVKEHLLWEVVTAQRAARRAGSASTKTRGEIRGTRAKMYKQKGTGRARHGSSLVPTFVGGGVAMGPKPRSYSQRTPKRVLRGGLISALSLRAQESKLLLVDKFELAEIKTARVASVLRNLEVDSGLIVDSIDNEKLIKSVRNLPKVKYLAPMGLNVMDVLKHDTLLMSVDVVKQVEERLLK